MEKISYSEARRWFWVRTWLWAAVAAAVTVSGLIAYFLMEIGMYDWDITVSFVAGIGSVLVTILTCIISIQFRWCRLDWKFGKIANGPVCAIIAAIFAFFVGGAVLNVLQSGAPDAFLHKTQLEAYLNTIDVAYKIVYLSLYISAFWGFVFGSWFMWRKDRYFVEQI